MKPETQEVIIKLIENNVAAGFVRGQTLFAESLDVDLEKKAVLEDVQLEGVMDYLLADYAQRN